MSSNEQYSTFTQTSRGSGDAADVEGLFKLEHYVQAFWDTPLPANFDELQKIPIEHLAHRQTPTPVLDQGIDSPGHNLCLLDHYATSSLKSGPTTALRFRPVDTVCTSADTSTSSFTYTKNIWPISQSHFSAAFVYTKLQTLFCTSDSQTSGRSEAKRHFMDNFRGAMWTFSSSSNFQQSKTHIMGSHMKMLEKKEIEVDEKNNAFV
ncbi:hypothetical protein Clacol_005871 [Clathrus columnatus]|uniref:Uncharacterized protein n=1 Tax=Clathrus columnatus TaxID=1419009 RepID=A0AAV5AI68_9AGAM|nr:hypothetical protein Clacol_005871 [Clathrus columnatus]